MLVIPNVGSLETQGQKHLKWHVTGVFNDHLQGECWKSPLFKASGATWLVSLYPNGQIFHKSKECIGIYLTKICPLSTTRLNYTLGLNNKDGTIYDSCGDTDDFEDNSWGLSKFLERSKILQDKDKLTSNDELSFFLELDCEIQCVADESSQTVADEDGRTSPTQNASCKAKLVTLPNKMVQSNEDHLKKVIADMFLQQRNCDVTISVKGKQLKAHRFMLSAQSPVFASMFDHEMVESTSGNVNIEDCEVDAFKSFLRYLYTEDADVLTVDQVFDVYFIADKYNVSCLRHQCVEILLKNFTVHNFCRAITLALKHNEPVLINGAEEFFFKNAGDILITTYWQLFLKENNTAANELFIKYTKQFNYKNQSAKGNISFSSK